MYVNLTIVKFLYSRVPLNFASFYLNFAPKPKWKNLKTIEPPLINKLYLYLSQHSISPTLQILFPLLFTERFQFLEVK